MPRIAAYIDGLETEIRSTIGSVIYALDVSQAELAELIGMTSTTMTARMKCPGTFRADELMRISEVARKRGYKCRFWIESGI